MREKQGLSVGEKERLDIKKFSSPSRHQIVPMVVYPQPKHQVSIQLSLYSPLSGTSVIYFLTVLFLAK